MRTLTAYLYIATLCICMWFPGFLLARNMITAIYDRRPTPIELLLCMIPFVNLGVARKQFYGESLLINVSLILVVVAGALKIMFYYMFNTPVGILISFILTIAFYVTLVLFWCIQAYTLWDLGSIMQMGIWTKICAVLIPPIACYSISQFCIPVMKSVEEDLEKERVYGSQ